MSEPSSKQRVRVYIACSLDGFIAGPGGDLSWLTGADTQADGPSDDQALGYEEFIAEVGALLMGRSTYDVVDGFDIPWPYENRPVHVATHRPLQGHPPTVTPVKGTIRELVAAALLAAEGADVYLDGGNLIRQALDAGLVDEMIITIAPIILGEGHALFAGAAQRHKLEFVSHQTYAGGMVQIIARPLTN